MRNIPLKEENPKGLHRRFVIRKIVGWRKRLNKYTAITKAVDENAEYFVLRLDKNGSDPKHIEACRRAIITYAVTIEPHLPDLAKDLILRYGS